MAGLIVGLCGASGSSTWWRRVGGSGSRESSGCACSSCCRHAPWSEGSPRQTSTPSCRRRRARPRRALPASVAWRAIILRAMATGEPRPSSTGVSRDIGPPRAAWEVHGQADPYWAIIPAPGTEGNRSDIDAFFAAGRADVAAILGQAADLRLRMDRAGARLRLRRLTARPGPRIPVTNQTIGLDVAHIDGGDRGSPQPAAGRCRCISTSSPSSRRSRTLISTWCSRSSCSSASRRRRHGASCGLRPACSPQVGSLTFQYTGRRLAP